MPEHVLPRVQHHAGHPRQGRHYPLQPQAAAARPLAAARPHQGQTRIRHRGGRGRTRTPPRYQGGNRPSFLLFICTKLVLKYFPDCLCGDPPWSDGRDHPELRRGHGRGAARPHEPRGPHGRLLQRAEVTQITTNIFVSENKYFSLKII